MDPSFRKTIKSLSLFLRKPFFGSLVILFLVFPGVDSFLLANQQDQTRERLVGPEREIGFLKEPEEPPRLEYLEGEILVKLETRLEVKKGKEFQGIDLDKGPVFPEDLEMLDPESQSLATLFKETKVERIEKVFKGTQDPATQLKKFKEKFSLEIAEGKRKINEKEILKTDLSRIYKLSFDKKIPLGQQMEKISKNPLAEYLEPNYLFHTFYVPDDPLYPQQWAHQKTQAELGWDIEKGSGEVVVAIVDTGVAYNHEDLVANMLGDCSGGCPAGKGYDFVDTTSRDCVDVDCNTPDNDPLDYLGHGTHVAGIAAATDNEKGIVGSCLNCKIMPLRVGWADRMGGGSLENEDIIRAIVYAADNGADIVNMSFGGYGISQTQKEAISYAYGRGVVLVAAAGNEGIDFPAYPAGYEEVIGVAATSQDDSKAFYSNFGFWIEVAAPGGDYSKDTMILSTVPLTGPLADPSGYRTLQGTSMATPYVAGLAGLVKSRNPFLTTEELRRVISQGTDGNIPSQKYIGKGRVNLQKTLQIDPNIVAKIDSPTNGSRVWTEIEIKGRATAPHFSEYRLSWGQGVYPSRFEEFYTSTSSVSQGSLAPPFDTRLLREGKNTIRLVVSDLADNRTEERIVIEVDNGQITYPLNNDIFRPGVVIPIRGRVNPGLNYRIEYGPQGAPWQSPTEWSDQGIRLIREGEVIAEWDTSSVNQANFYTLRLTIESQAGQSQEYISNIFLDPSLKEGWPQRIEWEVVQGGGEGSLIKSDLENTFDYYLPLSFNVSLDQKGSPLSPGQTRVLENPDGFLANANIDNAYSYYWAGYLEPVVVDLNQDGNKEIIIFKGGNPPKILVFRENGSLAWSVSVSNFDLPGGNLSIPLVGDLNNDNLQEIIFYHPFGQYPSLSKLYVFQDDGSLLWSRDLPLSLKPTMLMADLDLDGNREIVIKGNDSQENFMTIVDNRGGIKARWSLPGSGVGASIMSSPAVGNFDGDLELEIVSAGPSENAGYNWETGEWNNEGVISVYNLDGSEVAGWPVKTSGIILSSPVVADLDNDGKEEIVVGLMYASETFPDERYGGLYVFTREGKVLTGWPVQKGFNFWSTPALGDVDNDGDLEIAASKMGLLSYLFHHDGQVVYGWPQYTAWNDYYSSIIGDIDGDGLLDVLTTAGNGFWSFINPPPGGVYAWTGLGGRLLQGFPKVTELDAQAPATIADIDNDGKVELIASSSWDQDLTSKDFKKRGTVYVWELEGEYQENKIPWPMFGHDPRHTGNFKELIYPVPKPDWQGHYFDNPELKGTPILVRNDSDLNFNWGEASPGDSLGQDLFSVRWTRSLDFEEGYYLFKARSDDGIRAWLDEKLILDHWYIQAPSYHQSLPLWVTAGSHDLKVEYFENRERAVAQFWWEKQPSQAPIPIVIRAKGSSFQGQWPEMRLRINDQEVKVFRVETPEFQDFSYLYPKEIDYPAKIEIVFTNDAYLSPEQDRNLYIDYLKIGERLIQAEDSQRVVYDRALPWTWQTSSFDNLDVIEAREDMLWSGALRFNVASPFQIRIRARATPAFSDWPLMSLFVQEPGASSPKEIETWRVSNTTYQDFLVYYLKEIEKGAKIDVVFNNDAYKDAREDRNLYVDFIEVGSLIIQAEDPQRVSYDRGLGKQAFDGKDVIGAREDMLWSGALRFLIDQDLIPL